MNIDEYLESLENGGDNGGKDDDVSLEELLVQDNGQDDEDLDDVDIEDMSDETDDGGEKPTETKTEDKPNPDKQPEEKPEDNKTKTVQTPEQNAHFAEQRRQREAAIAEKALKNSPEYQMVQTLAAISGKSPEQLMQEVRIAQVTAELQRQGLPAEQAQSAAPQVQAERARAESLQARNAELEQSNVQSQFEQWQNRMTNETNTIKTNHPYLSDDDVTKAREYMLTVLRNPNVPLEQAVYAVHGSKILEEQKKLMRTEALAEISGRKGRSPLPPQGGNGGDTEVLNADERFAAKVLGLSEKDYMKWKKNPT